MKEFQETLSAPSKKVDVYTYTQGLGGEVFVWGGWGCLGVCFFFFLWGGGGGENNKTWELVIHLALSPVFG